MTVFFNPQRYRGRKALYRRFRAGLQAQGLPLLAVELAFGGRPFELAPADADIVVQLRAGSRSVMWQKERLLALGIDRLPAECDALAWLDCDVLFANPDWVEQTRRLLREFAVVQPFDLSVRLGRGQTSIAIAEADDPSYQRRPGVGCAHRHRAGGEDPLVRGHTGFAWAARRELFDGVGFYDRMIVGGGDTVLACGFFGRPANKFTHLLPPLLAADQARWVRRLSPRAAGSVSYTPGGLMHLWHGEPHRREIQARLGILRRHDFDPGRDVVPCEDGCLAWSGAKPGLERDVARYFWRRNEDGSRGRELLLRCLERLAPWFPRLAPGRALP